MLVRTIKKRRVRRTGGFAKRRRIAGPQRGFLRVGGYYGRFRGRRARANGELKFFDTTQATEASGTGGVIHSASLNLIPQGVTESTRVGRKCTITSLMIRGDIEMDSTTTVTDAENRARVIIYLDKQANGATAAVLDILETATIDSFRNLSNSGRFKVLFDKNWIINAAGVFGGTAAPASTDVRRELKWFKKCNVPVEFSATTGAITEIRSNNIGLLSIIKNAAATVNLAYTVRIRFSDN